MINRKEKTGNVGGEGRERGRGGGKITSFAICSSRETGTGYICVVFS